MKHILSFLFLISTIVSFLGCKDRNLLNSKENTQTNTYETFRDGFQNPPASARPKVYWWWLNGNVDTVRLKEELVAIKNAGISAVDIFEIGVPPASNPNQMIPAGPAFMGEESLQTIRLAIREASKLGLEVGLNLASSWNAGGTWTLPQHASKSLYFSKVSVKGTARQTVKLPFPEISELDEKGKPRLITYTAQGKPAYYEEVAVLAIPAAQQKNRLDTTQIINVSAYYDPEKEVLNWQAPAGEWDVFRYVSSNSGEQLKLPSPNSRAPIIDHYDSAATRAHLMYFVNQLKPLLGDFNQTGLKNFYLASYEATGSIWTSSLPAEFRKLHGYDLYKFIPALFDQEAFRPEAYERFENDFTKVLSELITNNHYRTAREIANRHGLRLASEAGGPGQPLHNVPIEALKALGALDIPRGEFWYKHYYYDQDSIDILRLVKEIASASNIYGRNIVEMEAFTSFHHWQEGPFDLKPIADRAFCEGMNRVVVHGFSHNPRGTGYPGIVYHAGTHYNDKRVWWPKIKPFNDYLARISYVLQEADFVADVLHYYGDKVPNFVYPKNTKFKVGPGYDYEMINTEVLVNNLTVQDGKLALPGGATFSVLYLEEEPEINPAVLQKLKQLAAAGATIIGTKPTKVKGLLRQPQQRAEAEQLVQQLWVTVGEEALPQKLEKGKIYAGLPVLNVLERLEVGPDISLGEADPSQFDYVHYRKEDLDFYLLQNTTDQWVSRYFDFRQQGKVPELWDPVKGHIMPAPVYREENQRLILPVTLPPHGSTFVVFRNGSAPAHYTQVSPVGQRPPLMNVTPTGFYFTEEGTFFLTKGDKTDRIEHKLQVQPVEGAWQVQFPKGWGAPEAVTFPTLHSWTKAENKGIQYFSGTATYHKTFQNKLTSPSKNQKVYLDLGEVAKVGEVWLNEQPLGISWAKPHRFDITDVLKKGENTLRVEVANTWSNRLTGDAITGEKYTNTNILTGMRGVPWAQVPLIESGLLGPVTIQVQNLIR